MTSAPSSTWTSLWRLRWVGPALILLLFWAPQFDEDTVTQSPETRTYKWLPSKEDSKISPLLRQMALGPKAVTQMQRARALSHSPNYVAGVNVAAESQSSHHNGQPVRFDGNVQVYMYMRLTNDEALAKLRAMGAQIEIVEAGIVQAWVPVAALEGFAALGIVREIAPPDYGIPQAGSVTTEGDSLLRSELVREWSSLTGSGVNIGLIDEGLDSIAAARQQVICRPALKLTPGVRKRRPWYGIPRDNSRHSAGRKSGYFGRLLLIEFYRVRRMAGERRF